MLQILIKRNGSEEPLIPAKLNGWSEWAANHLQGRVEWSQAALAAVAKLPEKASTRELMLALIDELLAIRTWPAYLMAGRLFATVYRKDVYGAITPPTVLEQHRKLASEKYSLMRVLDYTEAEYEKIETIIDHMRDFHYPEFALKQIREKYAIRNHVTGEVFETPQHLYMRMAMTLAEKEPSDTRLVAVRKFYNLFSNKKLSAPTPNYLYLGSTHNGYASCCIFTSDDDAESLAIGDHIAYKMTVNSAGLGSFINTRTVGDAVAKGRVKHGGKYRYLKANAEATIANKQAARAGAGTTSYHCFDPEAIDIVQYRNPMQPADKQLRELHFSMLVNPWFAAKVQKGEDIFSFTSFSAPDLFDAFFSDDIQKFVELYKKYEADPLFPKKYVSARKLVLHSFAEAFDTGTAYLTNIHEANRHTPFKISKGHRIHSSNLCQEIFQIQAPYYDMRDLYSSNDHGRGEIAMCNLAAIPIENILSDDEYFEAAYYSLKMIDHTILNGKYPFPHLEFTAKQRMNAGVGIMGLATHMARKGLRWDTIEGKQELHRVFERHMYFLIKASIAISKERGLAPWIHKTKWPEGWTPQKTYNRNVDKIAPFTNVYDWDALSAEIVANGGIAHSVLSAMMPGESSSKALGSTNSIYPIRSVVITKGDGEKMLRWAAVDGDILGDAYQSAWDIAPEDLIDDYAIAQKWTDQGISADMYRKFGPGETKVSEEEVVRTFLLMISKGLKSRYYTNTLRPKIRDTAEATSLVDAIPGAAAAAAATEQEAKDLAIRSVTRLKDKVAVDAEPTVLEFVTGTPTIGMNLSPLSVQDVCELFVASQRQYGHDLLKFLRGSANSVKDLPATSGDFGDSILVREDRHWHVWNETSWVKLYEAPSLGSTATEYVESEQEDACADGACKL